MTFRHAHKKRRIDWDAALQRVAECQRALQKMEQIDDERLAVIYRQRAEQMARPRIDMRLDGVMLRVLCFSLSSGRYALPLSHVVQVAALRRLTPVPGGPVELLGVTFLRGAMRSVLELSRLLEPDTPPSNGDGHLLMMRQAGREIGFRVAAVESIRLLRTEELKSPEENSLPLRPEFVRGVTADHLVVLDIEALWCHPIFAV